MNSQIEILYEDNHLIIVNKHPGQIVQGDKTGDTPLSALVADFIGKRDGKVGPAFVQVPHRLDRPVSGVTLFAKSSKALERLNEMFRTGQIKKLYWAITANRPPKPQGDLKHYLLRNEKQNKSYAYDVERKNAKEALLKYRVIADSERYNLIEVELLTGRHHQIRSQLSAIGCPIKGDLKYGAPRSNRDGSISLHARSVRFLHPVKREEIFIEAPPPEDSLWIFFTSTLKSNI